MGFDYTFLGLGITTELICPELICIPCKRSRLRLQILVIVNINMGD